MKKKLEAELISIAHRILKLKNKSEVAQLYLETQKLYEKLAVLKFVEENFADAKPTIGRSDVDSILDKAFDAPVGQKGDAEVTDIQPEAEVAAVAGDKPSPDDDKEDDVQSEEPKIEEPEKPEEEKLAEVATPIEKEVDEVIAEAEEEVAATEDEPVAEAGIAFEQPEAVQEVVAAAPEEAKKDDLFKPAFEWAFEPKPEEKTEDSKPASQTSQIAFEDLLGAGYKDPVFVKPEEASSGMSSADIIKQTDVPAENNWLEPSQTKEEVIPITRREDKVPVFKMSTDSGTIGNSKGITVGLNDRIAFVKYLFNNSSEDYNRVLSQLMTFGTLGEAQYFIDNMVKPDYDNWEGKDEYAQRFMEVIEKKFS